MALLHSVNSLLQPCDLNFEILTLDVRYVLDLALHHFEFIIHHLLLVLEFTIPVVLVNLIRIEVNNWLDHVEEIFCLLNSLEILR